MLTWRLCCCCSVVKLCPTLCNPWAVAHQALLSMGISRQERWSGLSFPSPGDRPRSRDRTHVHVSPALAGRFFSTEPPEKPGRESTVSFLFSSSPTAGFLFLSLKSDLPVDMCARKTERVGRKGERERKKVKETSSRWDRWNKDRREGDKSWWPPGHFHWCPSSETDSVITYQSYRELCALAEIWVSIALICSQLRRPSIDSIPFKP